MARPDLPLEEQEHIASLTFEQRGRLITELLKCDGGEYIRFSEVFYEIALDEDIEYLD